MKVKPHEGSYYILKKINSYNIRLEILPSLNGLCTIKNNGKIFTTKFKFFLNSPDSIYNHIREFDKSFVFLKELKELYNTLFNYLKINTFYLELMI